jgi:transposase
MRAMKPYSNDLRRKIVEAYESGNFTQDELADLFGVSNATVRNFIRRKRNTGSSDAFPHAGGRSATLADAEHDRLRQIASHNDDATLAELCQMVEKKFKKKVSTSAMCRLLQALDMPRKKVVPRFRARHSQSPAGERRLPSGDLGAGLEEVQVH